MAVGTGCVYASETGEASLQTPLRRSGRSEPAVAGRPSRHVAVEEVQRWNYVPPDGDRCIFETAWCIPLKNKSAASLVAAFTQLLRERPPITLQTDKGSEFLNRSVQKLLQQYGVHHFSTHNEETKASVVERFNRTLKTRMWRYFTKSQSVRYLDVLQDFVRSYNKTYHRSIVMAMAPSEVNVTNQEILWQRLYGHEGGGTPKFRIGDRVRISKAKRHFEKGYMANWTEELFTIVDAHRSDPPVYRLVDLHGDTLDGTFYEPELQKITVPKNKTYRVEYILHWRNKKKEALVKWFGYPRIIQQLDRCQDARQLQ